MKIGAIFSKLLGIPKSFSYPYRRVTERAFERDGARDELVTLECGHRLRLIHHLRAQFPCEACHEEGRK